MKSWKEVAFSVLLFVAFHLACSVSLFAQLADVPIKPGLWETHVAVNGGQPVVTQSCFTAGTKMSDYLTASNRSTADVKCGVTNKTQSGKTLSFDNTCTAQQITSKGHISIQLLDPDHLSGSSHTAMSGSAQGHSMNMTIDKTFTGKFVGTDCGSVKPMVPAAGK